MQKWLNTQVRWLKMHLESMIFFNSFNLSDGHNIKHLYRVIFAHRAVQSQPFFPWSSEHFLDILLQLVHRLFCTFSQMKHFALLSAVVVGFVRHQRPKPSSSQRSGQEECQGRQRHSHIHHCTESQSHCILCKHWCTKREYRRDLTELQNTQWNLRELRVCAAERNSWDKT